MFDRWLHTRSLPDYEPAGSRPFGRDRALGGHPTMKFSTRIDTDIAASDLFDVISNFPRAERALGAIGLSVRRIDPAQDPGTGLGWTIGFGWNGQQRQVRLDVTQFERPSQIALDGHSDLFDLSVAMSVVALSRMRSRLLFQTEIRARTMRSRMLLQTARLGKSQLDRKHDQRVGDFVAHLRAVQAT